MHIQLPQALLNVSRAFCRYCSGAILLHPNVAENLRKCHEHQQGKMAAGTHEAGCMYSKQALPCTCILKPYGAQAAAFCVSGLVPAIKHKKQARVVLSYAERVL
jgi:hypothetical protein